MQSKRQWLVLVEKRAQGYNKHSLKPLSIWAIADYNKYSLAWIKAFFYKQLELILI